MKYFLASIFYCVVEIPFLAFTIKEIGKNHFCNSMCVWWKIVPTVTENDFLQS